MSDPAGRQHWDNVYADKGERQVSWFQENPVISLELVHAVGATAASAIIDVGGGASRLVDALLSDDHADITVLDLSPAAIAIAKARLGASAAKVTWIAADMTQWEPSRQYDIWHDRAVFHFLTDERDRSAYVARLTKALRQGGHAIIGTFALDGPERCSGLPVVRYDSACLSEALGQSFELVETRRHEHTTPWGAIQHFQFSVFCRV
jgi:2-polyprenyl-3-methyl-5-hydroxy-6-metoxy-1,4-benzoquinol methylase